MSSLTSIESGSNTRPNNGGIHVAIISDGNGRWATAKGLPRSAGRRAGAETVREIIEAAPRMGIHTLTLFALSSANWQRPTPEIAGILRLLHEYLLAETSHCMEEGVRLTVIGRRDRLPVNLRQAIGDAEAATAGGNRLHLRLAIDYSARDAITDAAARWLAAQPPSREAFGRLLAVQVGQASPAGEASPRNRGRGRAPVRPQVAGGRPPGRRRHAAAHRSCAPSTSCRWCRSGAPRERTARDGPADRRGP